MKTKTQSFSRVPRLLAVVLAFLFVAAACGDDTESASQTTTEAPTTVEGDAGGRDDADGHDEADDDSGEAGAADVTLSVEVAGGTVTGDVGRQSVAVGDNVVIQVTSDTADHVHLHGYDVMVDVVPGTPAMVAFTADIPGAFEVELEDAGLLLLELEVS
jgi:hypothetical protein